MKMHYASLAIIFNSKGEILMSKRHEPRHRDSHGKWQYPGGGIEKGETVVQAAIRETMEEANITIKILTSTPITRIETVSKARNEFITLYGFPANYVSGTISCENDPESSEIAWINPSKIDGLSTLSGIKELALESIQIWKKH